MTPTAYPLAWPAGWPRSSYRQRARFDSTLAKALENLKSEVTRLGGKGLVLSSNYTLGANNPTDPGVVAYFTHDGVALAIPCDRWDCIEDNVQAIALTVKAIRGMDRWGAKHMIKAMFSGFKTLPAPATAARPWWEVLGVHRNCSRDEMLESYRKRALVAHPDRGGTHNQMMELNIAKDTAVAERGWV